MEAEDGRDNGEAAGMSEYALTPAERRALAPKRARKTGHAAKPGTGPAGETCGSCAHLFRNQQARTYLKCELMRHAWTGGAGSDVGARDPACREWKPHNTQTAGGNSP